MVILAGNSLRLRNYCTYEKQLLAIKRGIKKFNLASETYVTRTDNKSLVDIVKNKRNT